MAYVAVTYSSTLFVAYVVVTYSSTLFVAYVAVTYISTLSYKRHDYLKDVLEYKMCFDFLYNFCLKHFSFQEEFNEIS